MVILCWEKSENQHLKTFQEILFFHSDQETNILVPFTKLPSYYHLDYKLAMRKKESRLILTIVSQDIYCLRYFANERTCTQRMKKLSHVDENSI